MFCALAYRLTSCTSVCFHVRCWFSLSSSELHVQWLRQYSDISELSLVCRETQKSVLMSDWFTHMAENFLLWTYLLANFSNLYFELSSQRHSQIGKTRIMVFFNWADYLWKRSSEIKPVYLLLATKAWLMLLWLCLGNSKHSKQVREGFWFRTVKYLKSELTSNFNLWAVPKCSTLWSGQMLSIIHATSMFSLKTYLAKTKC